MPSVKRKCFFRVRIARGDKNGIHCSRKTSSQAKLQFCKTWSVSNTYFRMDQKRPFYLFHYAQYYHDVKVCVYHKITSLQFFRLHFSCIFISSKLEKFLVLFIHPQFGNIVILSEEHKWWSSSVRNSLLSHNTCSPFGPHTVSALSSLISWIISPTTWKFQKKNIYICKNL